MPSDVISAFEALAGQKALSSFRRIVDSRSYLVLDRYVAKDWRRPSRELCEAKSRLAIIFA